MRGGGDWFPFLLFLLLWADLLHYGENAVLWMRKRNRIPFQEGVNYRNN